MIRRVLCVAAILLCAAAVTTAQEKKDDAAWEKVAAALGKKGDLSADGVYKVTFPRSDLKVTMHGAPVPAGMGLASWTALTRMPDGKYMVMGDTMMLRSEVNKVIDALRAGGIEIVALHNHMLGEQPQIMFLHYQGRGDAEALARTVRHALDQLGKRQ